VSQLDTEPGLQAIFANEGVDQCGVGGRDETRRAGGRAGIEQMYPELAEPADGDQRGIAEQDGGAFRRPVEPRE